MDVATVAADNGLPCLSNDLALIFWRSDTCDERDGLAGADVVAGAGVVVADVFGEGAVPAGFAGTAAGLVAGAGAAGLGAAGVAVAAGAGLGGAGVAVGFGVVTCVPGAPYLPYPPVFWKVGVGVLVPAAAPLLVPAELVGNLKTF